MYPSTYHNNSNPSFTSTYIKPKMFSSMYSYNSNNTNLSKTPQEHYCLPSSSSSFQLLSPNYTTLEDGTISNEFLQQENMIICDDHSVHNTNNIAISEQVSSLQSDINNNGEDHDNGFNKPNNNSTKRRSSNDRHSKINTAQGPRERRMRLSLDVAKRFFKLQDMLGFEKASNTVEWLLMKSEPNIQELSSFKGVSNSASSTSQYEPLSENIDGQSAKSFSSSNHKEKRKSSTGPRKSSYLFCPLAKETREMARKRARERTLEKSSKLGCVSGGADQFSEFRPCLDQSLHQDVNRFGSSMIDPPEEASSQFQFKQGILGGYYSLMTGNWNPSFLFNNQPSGVLPQEHQLNDFQMIGNLWEGNNY